ncbi:CapA family protein [Candidatus Saccharibacteria bacterium]|nr:CapA family protein [Candidatus Saccharibacteria bacterium]
MDVIKKGRRKKSFVSGLIIFLCCFALVFFGIQFFTKTGIFRIPGVVYYDESLSHDELDTLHDIFTEEVDLDKDVTISASVFDTLPELEQGQYLYEVSVPVTDFYDERVDVSEFDKDEYEYIPIAELDFTRKLLSINEKYYLDDFDGGAEFRIITFVSEKFEDEIEPLVEATFSKKFPEKSSVLTFAQTGVTAMSRGMNSKLSAVGGDATYFAQNIGEFLSGFDLTHTSNESSFTEYASSSNICSKPQFINTLLAIGLDIVELTGNHNQDCGDTAAEKTIDVYNDNDIKIVGGGKTAEEAAKPLLIDEKNTNITFLAYNLSTGGATYDNTPGANQYYEDNFISEVEAAKGRGDFVIVDIQYYECSAYVSTYEDPTCDYANSAAGDQVGFFRHLIDLGADMVVGTSAHQPQTFELYGDGVIYYGLGNLFFDQYWWPGTTRSLILSHYFYNGKLLQTKIVPTVYDQNFQTKLLDQETSEWFIKRLASVRP